MNFTFCVVEVGIGTNSGSNYIAQAI
jgi:hypothetical protein